MGLDVDAVFAKQRIEDLSKLVFDTPHGEREEIADDIDKMVEILEEKYKETDNDEE